MDRSGRPLVWLYLGVSGAALPLAALSGHWWPLLGWAALGGLATLGMLAVRRAAPAFQDAAPGEIAAHGPPPHPSEDAA